MFTARQLFARVLGAKILDQVVLLTFCSALPLTAAIPQRPPAADNVKVVILADSNRDGKVDITENTDFAGKQTWTEESGALFLANIVDTDRRCSSQITGSCANNVGDIFGVKLPQEPKLDPKLAATRPSNVNDEGDWFNGLSESDKQIYRDWNDKYRAYRLASELAQEVDRRLPECHDAYDDILRNPSYLAPLRTVPNPNLGDAAHGSITVTNDVAASKVRLFHKTGGKWTFIASDYTFEAQNLKAGLELGIDARDVRRPGEWDGRATVELKVQDGNKEAKDSVVLRVAPVLTQHHGQPAQQLITATGRGDEGQKRFITELGEMSTKAGFKTPLHVFETSACEPTEIWVQDIFESGYMSIPGPNGPVSIHIMIRAARDDRDAGRKIFQDLRSNTVGAVQHLEFGGTTDALGNLETVPPYTHNGKSYAAGRAVMGSGDGEKPLIMSFLGAQETQAPIEIDTSFLAVKHTDEIIQFLPVESERGWVMMVADPRAGLEILQKAQKEGHGKEPAVSRPKSPTDPAEWRVTNTIDDLLNTINLAGYQDGCAKKIEKAVDVMKRETGITDAEIIRLPMLFEGKKNKLWKYSKDAAGGDAKPRNISEQRAQESAHGFAQRVDAQDAHVREADTPRPDLEENPAVNSTASSLEGRQLVIVEGFAVALYPGVINSLVLGNRRIVAPNPWGPVIGGQDVFAAAVSAAYAQAKYEVLYMDDWFTHHVKIDDVHCASNVIRGLTDVKWW